MINFADMALRFDTFDNQKAFSDITYFLSQVTYWYMWNIQYFNRTEI